VIHISLSGWLRLPRARRRAPRGPGHAPRGPADL